MEAPGEDKVFLENVNVFFQVAVEKVADRDAKMRNYTYHTDTLVKKVQEVGDIAQDAEPGALLCPLVSPGRSSVTVYFTLIDGKFLSSVLGVQCSTISNYLSRGRPTLLI